MITTRHIRFHLSELIQALECYGKLRRPSVSEALSFYYNWAQARGWRMRGVIGYPVSNRKIWVGSGDRTTQLEILDQDMAYEVVWSADDADGTPDFLEVFPVVEMVQRIVEELEDRGWLLAPDTDGYVRRFPFGEGFEDRHISGQQIYKASIGLKVDGELDAVVSGVVDGLEART